MDITSFYLPVKILEGPGSSRQIADHLGRGKTLLVTDKGLVSAGLAGTMASTMQSSGLETEIYDDVLPDPDEAMVMKLVEVLRKESFRQVVALGGGSVIDTAKAACCLAVNEGPMEAYQWDNRIFENPPLPLAAVPTTSGTGSEVSGVAVIGSRNTKKGIKQDAIFPKLAVIDPELMTGLPPFLTAITGMDALTHGIEAYTGKNRNPLILSLAESAIKLTVSALSEAVHNGSDIQARWDMAKAAMMAGIAMDLGGLGIVHSISAPFCTALHVSHGLGNTFLLPYALEFNIAGNEELYDDLARLLGGSSHRDCIPAILNWQKELGLEEALGKVRDQLASEGDLEMIGKIGSGMFLMKNNVKPASPGECTALLKKAAGL